MAIKGGGKAAPAKPKAEAEGNQEPKYSSNLDFLGQAFNLYCKGLSLRAVTSALRPEWPEVSERTVQRIAKEQKWDEARASFMVLHAKAVASASSLMPEVILQLQRMRAKLEAKAFLSAPELFAYRSIVEDLLILTGQHPKLSDKSMLAVSSDADIKALLEAIAEDDVVGPAWRKRKAQIQKAYKQKQAVTAGKGKKK